MFLKILQNSQENIWVRVSFLIKLLALAYNIIEKETLAQMFSCEFCETEHLFTEHLWATASVRCLNTLIYSTFPGKNISKIKRTLPGSI